METASSLREIAWKQLSEEAKKSAEGEWKEAEITIAQWGNQDELLGPIGIYFDPLDRTIIGYDARK